MALPFWPGVETIDLALIDDVPTALNVLGAILPNFQVGPLWMASDFLDCNPDRVAAFRAALCDAAITYEPHAEFKFRVPSAVGLIRTGDTIPYANVILQSA